MFFTALATDYDGTLATDGMVSERTIAALEALRVSGRKLILVTGRELADLKSVFARLDLFDRVVAENGALVVRPESGAEVPLAPSPPASFIARLKERRVAPLSVGRVVVATRVPHDFDVLETIRALGLELQIVFNKGAVMVLPPGVNKASGLAAAATELGLSLRNIVAVGDAENDHAFLRACGSGVAVANALDMLKEAADWVTTGARGDGVVELVDRLLANDLADLDVRRRIPLRLGRAETGTELLLDWRGERLLVAGPAAERNAWIAALVAELRAGGLQFVIIDRGGHYADLPGVPSVGGTAVGPKLLSVTERLDDAAVAVAVDLRALARREAAQFAADLLPRLQAMREQSGRPHWLVIDRADEFGVLDAHAWPGVIYGAGSPHLLAAEVLASLDASLLLDDAARDLGAIAAAQGRPVPHSIADLRPGEARLWRPASAAPPVTVRRPDAAAPASAPDRRAAR